MKIKVIITDNHTSYMQGIQSILSIDKTVEVIGMAESGAVLFDTLQRTTPDVILLDFFMPEMTGFEVLQKLNKEYPTIKTIVLSGSDDPKLIQRMFKYGAKGYILKDAGKAVIVEGINAVFDNKKFTCPKSKRILFQNSIRQKPEKDQSIHFSKNEKEVLKHIGDGLTAKEIAAKMRIREDGVSKYKQVIKRKINADNKAAIIKYAIKHGYTEL